MVLFRTTGFRVLGDNVIYKNQRKSNCNAVIRKNPKVLFLYSWLTPSLVIIELVDLWIEMDYLPSAFVYLKS